MESRPDALSIDKENHRVIPSYEWQTYPLWMIKRKGVIHPLLQGADSEKPEDADVLYDLSLLAKGRLFVFFLYCLCQRFIPSCEGQTLRRLTHNWKAPIHPFLRRAGNKSRSQLYATARFIPSCKGQTSNRLRCSACSAIHPFLRRAGLPFVDDKKKRSDSSPPAMGRLENRER